MPLQLNQCRLVSRRKFSFHLNPTIFTFWVRPAASSFGSNSPASVGKAGKPAANTNCYSHFPAPGQTGAKASKSAHRSHTLAWAVIWWVCLANRRHLPESNSSRGKVLFPCARLFSKRISNISREKLLILGRWLSERRYAGQSSLGFFDFQFTFIETGPGLRKASPIMTLPKLGGEYSGVRIF